MNVRNILLTAAIATLVACGGRDDNTQPDSGLPTGCTGACNDSGTPDSGTPDAGPNSCSAFISNSSRPLVDISTDPDAGSVVTLAQVRYGRLADGGFVPFHGHALINNAVVTSVSFVAQSGTEGFWIADDSDAGFYVYKRSSDTLVLSDGGVGANPQPGDVINLDAVFSTQPKYYVDEGNRYVLANNFFGSSSPQNRPLIVTTLSQGAAPAPLAIDANCAMDAHGGTAKLFQDSQPNAGRLVHINGPLTVTNARPTAMARVRVEQDGGATILGYNGFEVSGGILVNDHTTFSSDGGFGAPDHCDWALLADAGSTVTFPNGISGVWETYSMHPCIALGDGGCAGSGDNDYVPNTNSLLADGGNPTYTFALYPRGCTDLPGDAGAGVTP